ncbi:hypothetical protein AYK26_00785 [Euryarchaeota archaeon SM23-78]|nr:MAG: hypothetical protein AYK26_00785 [Euryarchaeota archaeon SM23-78]
MNIFIALLLSVVIGFVVGKILGPGKDFSWLAFGVALFVCLGGVGLIFGLAWWIIKIIFFGCLVVLLILIIRKIFGK